MLTIKNSKFDFPKTMADFISAVGNLVTNMKCLNHEEYSNDPRLVRDLAKKLPICIKKRPMHVNEAKKLSTILNPFVSPSLSDFYDWLKRQEKLATMLLAVKGNRFERPINPKKNEEKGVCKGEKPMFLLLQYKTLA